MLSISARGSASRAVSYYHHLSEGDAAGKDLEDYYARETQGVYLGSGADNLGLQRSATAQEFIELAAGYCALGKAQNAGQENRRSGWDLTFSAPKSVSIVWALADEDLRQKIETAHTSAVAKSIAFLEAHASYTRRKSGARFTDEERHEKVGLVTATYRHGASREADPQVHTHCMVFNLAPRADGTIGTLDPRPLYQWKMSAGAAYRSELAKGLKELGFDVERDGKSFRIAGIPQELEITFSKRRGQIEHAMKEWGVTSAKASEVAALTTRRSKQLLSREILIREWQARARNISPEWTLQEALERQHAKREYALDVATIQAEMTHQTSTVTEAQLYAYVAIEQQIFSDIGDIEKSVSQVKSDQRTVALESPQGTRYTTIEMQALEKAMVERAERWHQSRTHEIKEANMRGALSERPALSDEQCRAAIHLMNGGDLECLSGYAGTGKSTALEICRDVWEDQGYRVRGAALSGKAAQELEKGSGIHCTTLKRLEMDTRGFKDEQGRFHEPCDRLTARDVLVIDEAGMVGSRQMAGLLEVAERTGVKVVLVGDTRQLQAIEAGAPFRAVEERIGSVSLNNIQRQNNLDDRQAVRDLAAGRSEEALENLYQRGRVHAYETAREAKERMAQAIVGDMSSGRLSLGLTATREEARDVNEYARRAAQEQGLLKADNIVLATVHGEREFAGGDRVMFTRNHRTVDVKNGDLGTLLSIKAAAPGQARLIVTLDNGGERLIDTRDYDHLEYGYAITVHKAQGSTVDCAHILATDSGMTSREWAYVAGSRARQETHVYGDRQTFADLAPEWSRARQKDVSLDYTPALAVRPDRILHRAERTTELGITR